MGDNAKVKLVQVPCEACSGGMREHAVAAEVEESYSSEEDGWVGASSYQICKCRGCGSVRFREEFSGPETYNMDLGRDEPEVSIYPPPKSKLNLALDPDLLPDSVGAIYRETVAVMADRNRILAGGGLRATVEAICLDQGVEGNNLYDKIEALREKGLLTKPQTDLLHEERYLGNAALHEIKPAHPSDLRDGLDIIETLMKSIYVLPDKADRMRRRRAKAKSAQASTAAKRKSAKRKKRPKKKKN